MLRLLVHALRLSGHATGAVDPGAHTIVPARDLPSHAHAPYGSDIVELSQRTTARRLHATKPSPPPPPKRAKAPAPAPHRTPAATQPGVTSYAGDDVAAVPGTTGYAGSDVAAAPGISGYAGDDAPAVPGTDGYVGRR